MTFTFDLGSSDTNTLNIAKVRMEIGDVTENDGALPGGSNISDEEIAVLLDREDDNVMRAVAAACELLMSRWANQPTSKRIGPRSERYDPVKYWGERAKQLREQYGFTTQQGAFSAGWLRVDGYSDDVATDDTDSTSEYG